jgi:hypothetical protein
MTLIECNTYLQLRQANLSGRGFGPEFSNQFSYQNINLLISYNLERGDRLPRLWETLANQNKIH